MRLPEERHDVSKAKRMVARASLSREESVKLAQVRRFVRQMSGYDTNAEALRFLIRNWSKP